MAPTGALQGTQATPVWGVRLLPNENLTRKSLSFLNDQTPLGRPDLVSQQRNPALIPQASKALPLAFTISISWSWGWKCLSILENRDLRPYTKFIHKEGGFG